MSQPRIAAMHPFLVREHLLLVVIIVVGYRCPLAAAQPKALIGLQEAALTNIVVVLSEVAIKEIRKN